MLYLFIAFLMLAHYMGGDILEAGWITSWNQDRRQSIINSDMQMMPLSLLLLHSEEELKSLLVVEGGM